MKLKHLYFRRGIIFLSILALILSYILLFNDKSKNVANSGSINRGVGWINNQSNYSGSEFSFIINNSQEIAFEFDTNSKADQGAEILVDEKVYSISSPNLETQRLSIAVDKKKPHTVTVRHFCSFFYNPCQITIKGIYVERSADITSYRKHDKTLSILGDSISTIYGKNNYTHLLAEDLGYELHNASIIESTVSEVSGADNAIKRYKKDLMSFKSDVIIIFLGTNDTTRNVELDTFEKDYSKIVSDVKKFNPDGKIFLVGILQRNDINKNVLQNYNNVIKILAEKNNLYFIDPFSWLEENDFSDDVHPSLESQKKLAQHFQDVLSSILK